METRNTTGTGPAKLVRLEADTGLSGAAISMGEITTIGRSAGNTVVVDNETVSRHHALIRREGDCYVLLDLGSANGTFVNNRPISSPMVLEDNDTLKLGDVVFSIRYAASNRAPRAAAARRSTRRFFADVTIAVLVSDIRNYTTLSEQIAADRLSALLAEWFRRAGECIDEHSGIIEKFRGDSLLAYWVAGEGTDADHVTRAIAAARDLVNASRQFDDQIAASHSQGHFKIGCGIHVGGAVLGNIGADARRDFTTLGDCVNAAFRIESHCSSLDREILISGDARRLAPQGFEFDDLGCHSLKGKTEPVPLFALRLSNSGAAEKGSQADPGGG